MRNNRKLRISEVFGTQAAMFNATYCCCGCTLEEGAKKIGWFLLVVGFMAATIDMFKLAILVKDPELSYATPAPHLLKNLTKEEVVEVKKVGMSALLTVECLEIVCGVLMLCGISLKSGCAVLIVCLYLFLDIFALAAQFLLLIIDPHFFYIISTVERGSFYHCIHTMFIGIQTVLLIYFARIATSYLCATFCRADDT